MVMRFDVSDPRAVVDPPEETFFENLYRLIDSISDEVRSTDPDLMAIDFWAWKIKTRITILEALGEDTTPEEKPIFSDEDTSLQGSIY